MCIFQCAPHAWTREVPQDKPLTAYKALCVDRRGIFYSPVRRKSRWLRRELHLPRVDGAIAHYRYDWIPGIHCMTSVTGGMNHLSGSQSVVVRLAIWGTVMRYKSRRNVYYGVWAPFAGFLAQHARIEAIVYDNDSWYWKHLKAERYNKPHDASLRAFKRYPATVLNELPQGRPA